MLTEVRRSRQPAGAEQAQAREALIQREQVVKALMDVYSFVESRKDTLSAVDHTFLKLALAEPALVPGPDGKRKFSSTIQLGNDQPPITEGLGIKDLFDIVVREMKKPSEGTEEEVKAVKRENAEIAKSCKVLLQHSEPYMESGDSEQKDDLFAERVKLEQDRFNQITGRKIKYETAKDRVMRRLELVVPEDPGATVRPTKPGRLLQKVMDKAAEWDRVDEDTPTIKIMGETPTRKDVIAVAAAGALMGQAISLGIYVTDRHNQENSLGVHTHANTSALGFPPPIEGKNGTVTVGTKGTRAKEKSPKDAEASSTSVSSIPQELVPPEPPPATPIPGPTLSGIEASAVSNIPSLFTLFGVDSPHLKESLVAADKKQKAVDYFRSKPELIDVYKKAAEKTGVPWEILAGIHYREGIGLNKSLASGREIGKKEPDIEKAQRGCKPAPKGVADGLPEDCTFSSLIDSAYFAGEHFKGKNGNRVPATFEDFIATLSSYNGGGNSNSRIAGYSGVNRSPGDSDPYVMSFFDAAHAGLRIRYEKDGILSANPKPDTRPGAMTVAVWVANAFKPEATPVPVAPVVTAPPTTETLPSTTTIPSQPAPEAPKPAAPEIVLTEPGAVTAELARRLLTDPRISIARNPKNNDRVYRSVERLRDNNGRTFLVDIHNLGNPAQEILIQPQALMIYFKLADAGFHPIVNSLTTSNEHSPTGDHPQGKAGDVGEKNGRLRELYNWLKPQSRQKELGIEQLLDEILSKNHVHWAVIKGHKVELRVPNPEAVAEAARMKTAAEAKTAGIF